MELIPGPETDPTILAEVAEFADRRLGKGVVDAKDIPDAHVLVLRYSASSAPTGQPQVSPGQRPG